MQPYSPNNALGIDVSKYQPKDIDWRSVQASGISFVYVRATAGRTITDGSFKEHVAGAKAAGLLVGAYHYFYAQSPEEAEQEAQHFLEAVGDISQYDLPPMLDVEDPGLPADGSLPGICRSWLEKIETAHGRKPVIYTSPGFAVSYLDDSFADYPLWVSHYTDADQPADVPGWKQWTFWQYSETGRVPGISGEVDLNRFYGTEEELKSMAEEKKTNFPDVEAGRWSEASIAVVAKLGLMTGYEDGTFRPTQAVTREELAKVLNDVVYMINSKTEAK